MYGSPPRTFVLLGAILIPWLLAEASEDNAASVGSTPLGNSEDGISPSRNGGAAEGKTLLYKYNYEWKIASDYFIFL